MNLIKKIILGSNVKILPLALGITFFGIILSNNYNNFALLLSGLFTIAFVYLFNTFCDIEEDKFNKVAYTISSPFERFILKIVLVLYLILSLFFSLISSIISFAFILLIVLLGFFYSFKIKGFRFKNILLVKNIVTSLGWSLLIFVGSMQLNILTFFSALLIFIILFTASSLADIEDMKGDLKVGIITLPAILGIRRFSYLILLIQCSGILLILLSILYNFPSYLIFIALVYCVYAVGTLYSFRHCLKRKEINVKCWRKTTIVLILIADLIILAMDFFVFFNL
jgi:4-hydroxybenzoate polyprenyltransferase